MAGCGPPWPDDTRDRDVADALVAGPGSIAGPVRQAAAAGRCSPSDDAPRRLGDDVAGAPGQLGAARPKSRYAHPALPQTGDPVVGLPPHPAGCIRGISPHTRRHADHKSAAHAETPVRAQLRQPRRRLNPQTREPADPRAFSLTSPVTQRDAIDRRSAEFVLLPGSSASPRGSGAFPGRRKVPAQYT